MPKRSYAEKLDHYRHKIRRLEEKENKRLQQITESSDSNEENSENELQPVLCDQVPVECAPEVIDHVTVHENLEESPREPTPTLELDADILAALGEAAEEVPQFGEKIHDNLARLWAPILRKGVEKEAKEKLMKQYQIPENCTLLQAPKLNPEIAATISDVTKCKEKRVESAQQQLGLGITALNRGLSLLLDGEPDKVKAIKLLSDSSRILCDLHYMETEVRKKFMMPGLDKGFLNLIQDIDRDETLFGQTLSEKIKASKAIEKQGLQIKKVVPIKTTAPSAEATTNRTQAQGNWSGPSRFATNRGRRQTYRKPGAVGLKPLQISTMKQPSTSQSQQTRGKSHAPVQRR